MADLDEKLYGHDGRGNFSGKTINNPDPSIVSEVKQISDILTSDSATEWSLEFLTKGTSQEAKDFIGVQDGSVGPEGPKGDPGPQGLTGERGPQGVDGPMGPAGSDGLQGPEGSQGPAGKDGLDGAQGPKGIDGTNGSDGAQGPKGDTGPAGKDGPDGAQGPEGPQGPKGDVGASGASGLNWKGEYSNTVEYVPNDAVAYQGATYFSLTTHTGVAPLPENANWAIMAASGAQGPEGPQGPKGDAGADGSGGAQGPEGPQGPQGPKGTDGANGVDGAQGPQGPKGADGANGSQGPTGLPGKDGAQGPRGLAGDKGLNWKGYWNTNTTYQKDDAVLYLGTSYISIAGGNKSYPPGPSSAFWSILASKGDSQTYKGTYVQGTLYQLQDTITYKNAIYICVKSTPGSPQVPPDDVIGGYSWYLCIKAPENGTKGEKGDQGPQGPAMDVDSLTEAQLKALYDKLKPFRPKDKWEYTLKFTAQNQTASVVLADTNIRMRLIAKTKTYFGADIQKANDIKTAYYSFRRTTTFDGGAFEVKYNDALNLTNSWFVWDDVVYDAAREVSVTEIYDKTANIWYTMKIYTSGTISLGTPALLNIQITKHNAYGPMQVIDAV